MPEWKWIFVGFQGGNRNYFDFCQLALPVKAEHKLGDCDRLIGVRPSSNWRANGDAMGNLNFTWAKPVPVNVGVKSYHNQDGRGNPDVSFLRHESAIAESVSHLTIIFGVNLQNNKIARLARS